MTRYLIVLLGLMVAVACASFNSLSACDCPCAPALPPTTTADRGVLPADESKEGGFELDLYANPVKTYTRDNLYLYLGDKTDRYNEYGFQGLTHGIYRPFQKDFMGKPTVVVDAYAMDLPLNAFGLYSVERSREDKLAAIGGGASVGAKECVFWKGNTFVRVKLLMDVENAEEVLTKMATRTAEKIAGVVSLPELAWFPADKRTTAGDQYVVKNLLGYPCLGRGMTMEYDLEGGKATMFVAMLLPGQTIKKDNKLQPLDPMTSFLELRRTLINDGSTPQVLPGPWDNSYRATDPKLGRGLVARKGCWIVGLFGTMNDRTAADMVSALVKAIP